MEKKDLEIFEDLKIKIGSELRRLRIEAGHNSYEIFAWEHNISRIQYWKMEKGTNCTLKSLVKVLNAHNISIDDFFSSLNL